MKNSFNKVITVTFVDELGKTRSYPVTEQIAVNNTLSFIKALNDRGSQEAKALLMSELNKLLTAEGKACE